MSNLILWKNDMNGMTTVDHTYKTIGVNMSNQTMWFIFDTLK
jgi:hypothetical protein